VSDCLINFYLLPLRIVKHADLCVSLVKLCFAVPAEHIVQVHAGHRDKGI